MPAELAGIADGNYTIGFQPHHLSLAAARTPSPCRCGPRSPITEITGSESFIHLDFADVRWVMLTHGIRDFEPDEMVEVFIDPRHIMVFDEHGRAVGRAERWRHEEGDMARIDLNHIRHSYLPNPQTDADIALKEVHHTFEDGGAYALLGPSGCGKTTLLNIISGLLHPSHGQLLFNGRDVTNLSTQERNIAQVFQFPVIYDTMTVYDNLAFPLRNRGVPEADVDRKVRETLEMIDLAGMGEEEGAAA